MFASDVFIFKRGFNGAKKCLGLLSDEPVGGIVVIATVSIEGTLGCSETGCSSPSISTSVLTIVGGDSVLVGTNVVKLCVGG